MKRLTTVVLALGCVALTAAVARSRPNPGVKLSSR
jgi:hypothetical protein